MQHAVFHTFAFLTFSCLAFSASPFRPVVGQLSEVAPFLLLEQRCGLWNGLPSDVTSASSLSVFKNRLKTYLFRRCYETV